MKHQSRPRISAFTLVEMIIVIAVVGILAGLSIVGYGAWQKRSSDAAAKSDLQMVAAAMNNAKNFGSGYPTSLPSSIKASDGMTITYASGDASGYCVNISGPNNTAFHIDTRNGGSDAPKTGSCPVSAIALTDMRVGAYQTCAIGNGKPYCWGYGSSGEIGNGASAHVSVPTAATTSGALAGKTVVEVSPGNWHTCARTSDNRIYCWGLNHAGQLGNGTTTNSNVPVPVTMSGAMAGKTVTQLTSGGNYSCARVSDGNAYCWGTGSSGVRGDGSYANATTPVQVALTGGLSGRTIKQIDAGENFTCAVGSDDRAYCWGYGYNGQMGNGTGGNGTTDQMTPVAVSTSGVLSGLVISSVSAGVDNACVRATNGRAYCWGSGFNGLLGNGSSSNSYVPVAVATTGVLSGLSISSVSVGEMAVCAQASNGRAYCWGVAARGERGDGTSTTSNVPTAVSTSGVLNGKTLNSVWSGYWHGCGNATDGNVYCWGYNSEGELGNNSTTNSLVPVQAISPTT